MDLLSSFSYHPELENILAGPWCKSCRCAQVDRCTEVMLKFADCGCCPEAEWCQHGFSFINLYIITVYGSPSLSALTVVLSSLDFKAPAVS